MWVDSIDLLRVSRRRRTPRNRQLATELEIVVDWVHCFVACFHADNYAGSLIFSIKARRLKVSDCSSCFLQRFNRQQVVSF